MINKRNGRQTRGSQILESHRLKSVVGREVTILRDLLARRDLRGRPTKGRRSLDGGGGQSGRDRDVPGEIVSVSPRKEGGTVRPLERTGDKARRFLND